MRHLAPSGAPLAFTPDLNTPLGARQYRVLGSKISCSPHLGIDDRFADGRAPFLSFATAYSCSDTVKELIDLATAAIRMSLFYVHQSMLRESLFMKQSIARTIQ